MLGGSLGWSGRGGWFNYRLFGGLNEPPRLRELRRLREILLIAQPPLLSQGGESPHAETLLRMRSEMKINWAFLAVFAIALFAPLTVNAQSFDPKDLQGTWTNATITPFERPAAFANKKFLTEKEVKEIESRASDNRVDRAPQAGDVGTYNQFWFDSGTKVVKTRRTSLVVEPKDGRVPLRPEAEAKRDSNAAHNADAPEYMSVWDRCITRGVPAGMFPAGYNNAYQIMQGPDVVVIYYEMIHEARIIPLNSRQHLPAHVKSWNGDARGRWEGNTLVVDTTNYNNKGWIAAA